MMAQPANRFEFRAWDRDLRPILSDLSRNWRLGGVHETVEEHVLYPGDSRYDARICRNRLEVRIMQEKGKYLERWKRHEPRRFPLSAATILRSVCPALAISHRPAGRAEYSVPQFLEEFVRPTPHLVVVPAFKKRSAFWLEGYQAEFTEVWVNSAALETVAVSAEDPVEALSGLVRLGLQGYENCSYVRAIKAIVGMELATVTV